MARKKTLGVKVGFRKPSVKKSIRARTTGKYKRRIKRSINPFYGKKGMGFIKNPRRSVRNKIYKKTTFGLMEIIIATSYQSNEVFSSFSSSGDSTIYKSLVLKSISASSF